MLVTPDIREFRAATSIDQQALYWAPSCLGRAFPDVEGATTIEVISGLARSHLDIGCLARSLARFLVSSLALPPERSRGRAPDAARTGIRPNADGGSDSIDGEGLEEPEPCACGGRHPDLLAKLAIEGLTRWKQEAEEAVACARRGRSDANPNGDPDQQ
ncbi:hypothetical protein BO71DRAFT_435163 [Aspergillus ellipticus CBS 707.79]|uniref:Uncharacterized protein n=1 Tax=Aspergillus ellipticus CBS 707.79 TaxID=1448320 RepID=A0A319CUX0_9EURO|nr:hypothetical protein BO71DRAFT_435163 [Aspergillus ellipticus CBS 707.79]